MTDPTTDSWLIDVRTEATDRLSRIAEIQAELSCVYAEARTAGGRVRVRVNAAGRPSALTIEPGALSLSASVLAASILQAIDSAAAAAGERVAALVGPLVPSEDLDAMLTGRPTEADRAGVRAELEGLRDVGESGG